MSRSQFNPPQLRPLPWQVVVDALIDLGFGDYEDHSTHVKMWGLDGDGEGVVLRITKIDPVPSAAQKFHLGLAKIPFGAWLQAVSKVEAKAKKLPD